MAFNVFDDDKNKIPLTKVERLLWYNPHPTNDFEGTEITIESSDGSYTIEQFTYIDVITVQGQVQRFRCAQNSTSIPALSLQQISMQYNDSNVYLASREIEIKISDHKIEFYDCYKYLINSSSTPTKDNSLLVPMYIRGVTL